MTEVTTNVADGGAEKRGRPEKALFDKNSATDADGNAVALNDAGELTGVPVNFDAATHRKITSQRGWFASKPVYWGFKAQELRRQADALTAKADDLDERAANHGKPVSAEEKQKRSVKALVRKLGGAEALMALLADLDD